MKVQAVLLSLLPEDACYLKWLAYNNPNEEICGLVRSGNLIQQFDNLAPDRSHDFIMDFWPSDNITAIWHSHNNGLARPSYRDVPVMEMMHRCGHNYNWIIVTQFGLFEYRLVDIE